MTEQTDISSLEEFKIRVYGFLLNGEKVLLSHERYQDLTFCKLPGGGMELGENTKQCLKREFKEELLVNIEVSQHVYTCDFLVQNRFYAAQQVIGVYYVVKASEADIGQINANLNRQRKQGNLLHLGWEWVEYNELIDKLSFKMDKIAAITFLDQ